MSFELFARFLFISEHPFIRWNEATGEQKDAYTRKARRIFEMSPHDFMLHNAHKAIKETIK